MCVSFFPFGIEGGMWDAIVLIPDHCLSIYFTLYINFRPPPHPPPKKKEDRSLEVKILNEDWRYFIMLLNCSQLGNISDYFVH